MPLTELQYDEKTFQVTPDLKKAFDRDGAVMVRNFLSEEELEVLLKSVTNEDGILKHSYGPSDGMGRTSRLALWNQPGNDVTGMLARSEKVAGTCEQFLRGEVYHYHTKVMLKDAKVGGTHLWHQDYGYWYLNGNLKPDMMTAYIALDKCVKENGCLQVVLGTNRCGRIEHSPMFDDNIRRGQVVAEEERVNQLLKHHEHLHVEMNAGDCLFFHCNVLHTAGKNDSDMRRWTMLCCYNRADNNPYKKHHHPQYTPLHKVPNTAMKECTNFTDLSGKDFMHG